MCYFQLTVCITMFYQHAEPVHEMWVSPYGRFHTDKRTLLSTGLYRALLGAI